MPSNEGLRSVTFKAPPALVRKAATLGSLTDRSLSQVIRDALRDHIKKHPKARQLDSVCS